MTSLERVDLVQAIFSEMSSEYSSRPKQKKEMVLESFLVNTHDLSKYIFLGGSKFGETREN